jgi:hypothetical protein
MAKGKIFIGEIMGDMVTALSSMSGDMVAVVSELQAVNETVGQGVQAGNVVAGDGLSVILNENEFSYAGSGSAMYEEIGRVKCFANGTIRLSGAILHTGNATAAKLFYSLDNGTTKTEIGVSDSKTVFRTVSKDIAVSSMQEVILYLYSGYTGTPKCQAGSCKVSYDLVNLANDGFVIKV